jgi:ribose-phosphate pyrophosphokinase
MPILINNKPIEFFKFPGGECQVNIVESLMSISTYDTITVKAYLYNSDDLISLLLTIDAIRRTIFSKEIDLIIPYFPYARQDRVCNCGESLSIKVIADLINSLNCQSVTIYDPHSNVTPALINNCTIINQYVIIRHTALHKLIYDENLILISPDQGAEKKVREIAMEFDRPMLCATKVRDTKTGEIVRTSINIDDNEIRDGILDDNFLIIDDICDGGRTFIEIAQELKRRGFRNRNLYLYVTHGIFSKGLEVLKPHFNKVYCYHTFLPLDKIDAEFLQILGETHAN